MIILIVYNDKLKMIYQEIFFLKNFNFSELVIFLYIKEILVYFLQQIFFINDVFYRSLNKKKFLYNKGRLKFLWKIEKDMKYKKNRRDKTRIDNQCNHYLSIPFEMFSFYH